MSTPANTTPPFPPNGAGTDPVFDGHSLILLKGIACPPETLEAHVSRLDKEFDPPSDILNAELDVEWPVDPDSPLGQILTRDALMEWDYDLFKLRDLSNGHPLVFMAHGMIQMFDLVAKLNLDVKVLHRFLCALERTYNKCIYHNPMHAADVMHATAYLLEATADAFPPEEIFVALLSGCGHDVGHPGVNNNYMLKQSHPLATRYGIKGVLENHHVALSINLMDMPALDFLAHVPGERRKALQEMLRQMVLVTDMSEHASMVKRLEELAAAGTQLDLTKQEDRLFGLQCLIHSADLSNPCKRWNIHIQWTHAIVAEFFSQGDFERSKGLEVSPMCDRTVNCGRSSQKYFIQHFCRPLFVLCPKAMPKTEARCKGMVEQLDANVARWTSLGF